MDIQFEGKAYNFPDDFTPDEISTALHSIPKPADWWKTVKAIPGTALGQSQQALGGMAEAVGDLTRIDPLSAAGKGMRESGSINVEEANPGELSYWQRAVLGGVSSAAQQLPTLAAAVIAGSSAPALIGAGALTFGGTYGEAKEAGLGGLRAGAVAGVDAAVEVVMERIPLKFLLDNVGGPILKTIAGTIAREVPTEVATTALQQLNAMFNHKPDMSWQEYGQGVLDTIGATMVSAPLLAGAATAMRPLGPRVEADQRIAGTQPGDINTELPSPLPPASVPAPTAAQGTETAAPTYDLPSRKLTPELEAQLKELLSGLDVENLTDEDEAKAKANLQKIEEERQKAADTANAPPPTVIAQAWNVLAQAETAATQNELGQTKRAAANAGNYENPNDALPYLERPFFIAPEGEVGKRPMDLAQPQKTTYVLGEPTADRDETYLRALQETVEGWRQQYLPDSTIVLANESLFTDSANGWQYGQPGFHVIVPAALRNVKDVKKFNSDTLRSAFYNITHEFGHALLEERFFEGVDPMVAQTIQALSRAGTIGEDLIAQLPLAQQSVVREFNAMKQAVMTNKMTAQEFMERWINPAKTKQKNWLKDLGVAPTDSALAVGKALAMRAVANHVKKMERQGEKVTQKAQKELRDKLVKDYFSLHEYLAEQTTRYAYKNKWDESPLGQWMKHVMDSLRSFFAMQKKEQLIAPGVAFQEWMDGLTMTEREGTPKVERVAEAEKKVKAVKKKTASTEGKPLEKPTKKKAAAKPVKKVQHNVETDTSKPKEQVARGLILSLVRDGSIDKDDSTYTELMTLVKEKDWDALRDELQPLLNRKVKFELDNADRDPLSVLRAGLPEGHAVDQKILAEAQKEWKEQGFHSRYFKAWFGDWVNDPQQASKVVAGDGQPLVLYHWTNATDLSVKTQRLNDRVGFLEFKVGDVGFHFGTVRAAHIRMLGGNTLEYAHLSDQELAELSAKRKNPQEGSWIIPVVLNIRNPLRIGKEHQSFWASPDGAVAFIETFLKTRLDWSDRDTLRALRYVDSTNPYDRFAAFREILVEKGYDGIVYQNTYEGDTAYVALHPNQVKTVIGNSTFSTSSKLHMELDYDRGSDSGTGAAKLFHGVKNFVSDKGPLRRALRAFQNLQYKVFELQQLATLHPDVPELVDMNRANTAYNTYKSKLQASFDSTLAKWDTLGKENFAKLNKYFNDYRLSDELWVALEKQSDGTWVYKPTEKMNAELLKRGIDITTPDGALLGEIALEGHNALLEHLNEMERVFSTVLANRYSDNLAGLQSALIPLTRQIHALRKKPFFPQGRFGNLMLTVERRDVDGRWVAVHKEAFENEQDWKRAHAEAASKETADLRVRAHRLTDAKYVLIGLPQDFIDVVASELDLSDTQVENLTSLLQPIKTEKALRPYELAALGLTGYSADAMRSFSNFGWHNSNLLAKMRFRSVFASSIRSVRSRLRAAQYGGPSQIHDVLRLDQIAHYMESTRDFIMAPPYEAQAVRAAVSIGYLAFNIKTALVNFYGLVTTWSDLTTRQGIIPGTATLMKATKASWQSLNIRDLNSAKRGAPQELQEALDQALKEGVLAQSYAYHLAGMANSSNLTRMPGRQQIGKLGRSAIDLGMWPFRLIELSTRRITFLAAYESAIRDKQMSPLDAYQTAVDRTNLLQNDYSLGNRAPIMRGIKTQSGNKVVEAAVPLATVFMTFMQHMAFHSYGGYELGQRRSAAVAGHEGPKWYNSYTAKIWLITLLLAGYEGLPGAENLLDLLEAAWRKIGGAKTIRQSLREYVQTVTDDPIMVSRGLGHNIGGFDVSRSVGLGRFVPGTDVLAHPRDSVAETFGTLVLDAMGATGGFIKFGLEAMFNDKHFSDNIARMPGGAGNIIAALKWSQDGVQAPSGALITRDRQTGEVRDLTSAEILGKAMGFNPTIVAENREIRFEQMDRKIYWTERRKMLLDDYWKARLQKDREALTDVKKAIQKFNADIPNELKSVRITGPDITKSMQARQRQFLADQKGTSVQRKYRSVYADVDESHGQP